jgi:hypothetical protein
MNKASLLLSTFRSFYAWQKSLIYIFALTQSILILHSRPSQDDYGFLYLLTNYSFFEVTERYWDTWGGNISMALATSAIIKLALVTEIWIAYAFFGLISSLLIGWAAFAGLSIFHSPLTSRDRIFTSILFSLIGLSNLAFPAHLASLAFISAAIAHLWPICLFLILLWRLEVKRQNVLILFVSGLFISNANIVEGATIAVVTFVLLILKNRYFRGKPFSVFPRMQSLIPLLLGQTLGLAFNFMAPGFSARVDVVSANRSDENSLIHSFWSAFVAFTGAIMTTTLVLFLFVFLAISLVLRELQFSDIFNAIRNSIIPMLLFGILFGMLIGGSTIAYASWHQSLGLVFLGSLVAFVFISKLIGAIPGINQRKTYASLILFLSIVFVFDVTTGYSRGSNWDKALQNNACAIKIGEKDKFLSADLVNPISKLGFEDIGTWEWMRKDYINWLESSPNSFSCK